MLLFYFRSKTSFVGVAKFVEKIILSCVILALDRNKYYHNIAQNILALSLFQLRSWNLQLR